MSDWKSRATKASSGDWRSRAQPVDNNTGVPGSPLEKALAEQPEDVVTVQTPTGPAQFTRDGSRFYSPGESQQMLDAGGARLKERALEAGLSTLSGGGPLMDEMAGMLAGVDRDDPSGLNAYRRGRDSTRRDVSDATRRTSPQVDVAGARVQVLPALGAAIPSLLAPIPAGWLARIAGAGAQGGVQATGESTSDLTGGDVSGFLRDVGSGAGVGALAGGAAEGVTAPMSRIARGAASRIGDSVAGQAAVDLERVGAEVRTLQGAARSETQKGSRLTENILRRANGLQVDPSTVTDPVQQRAIAMLDEQAFKDLGNSVASNSMDEVPAQLRRMADAKAAASSAAASATQDASDRTRDYFAQSTFGTQIQPRAVTLAENAALGGAAGAVTGGASGLFRGGLDQLADGVIAGVGGSALSGGSGFKTLAKNAMASPLVQTSALGGLIQATQGAQSGFRGGARLMSPVSQAARKDPLEKERDAINAFLTGG